MKINMIVNNPVRDLRSVEKGLFHNVSHTVRYATLAVFLICLFAACAEQKGKDTQDKIIPVKVMEINATTMAGSRNYVGTIEESFGISLSFSSMGTVEQVLVSEGQKVSKGELLATLNAETARNAYELSLAKLVQAQDAYDRLAKVHEKGSLPDIKFAEVEAGLQQAKSMAAISQKNLEDCRLYVPHSGVIANSSVEVGANVMSGVEAFKLVQTNKVFAKFFVPENEINNTHKGQNAVIEVVALDNAKFTGKIETKGVVANPVSHSYEVKIGIDNPQSKLFPGMVCKVYVDKKDNSDNAASKIVVPNNCIKITADGKQYVWLSKDNIAKRQLIQTGELTDYGIVVVEGLTAGDNIIVEGFQKISEGTRVSIKN